jgi:hypothetical protein
MPSENNRNHGSGDEADEFSGKGAAWKWHPGAAKQLAEKSGGVVPRGLKPKSNDRVMAAVNRWRHPKSEFFNNL